MAQFHVPKNNLLVLDNITIRWNERAAFPRTCWTWRRGEQWAVLGPNNSGKSLLALALCGKAPLMRGEIHYHFDQASEMQRPDAVPEQSIALLSPQIQRDLATGESSFYQSRWHSGVSEGRRTVAQFLSQTSVEDINPFAVDAPKGNPRRFRENRRRFSRWLGIEPLFRRKLAVLSNGEQRRVLLVHTLLRSPQLLILDDPFGGLDHATRARLKTVIHRLMRAGLPVLLITNRPDELPSQTTHLLLVRNQRIIAQGSRRAMLNHPLARKLACSNSSSSSVARRRGVDGSPSKARTAQDRAAPLVELNHVTVRLGRQRILDDVTWTMRRGENWALVGPNGSGKTTLLSLIQGDNPQAYALDLRLFGQRPETTQTLWHLRRRIGWLSPELHLHYPAGLVVPGRRLLGLPQHRRALRTLHVPPTRGSPWLAAPIRTCESRRVVVRRIVTGRPTTRLVGAGRGEKTETAGSRRTLSGTGCRASSRNSGHGGQGHRPDPCQAYLRDTSREGNACVHHPCPRTKVRSRSSKPQATLKSLSPTGAVVFFRHENFVRIRKIGDVAGRRVDDGGSANGAQNPRH